MTDALDADRFIFLDEAGASTAMDRTHGRAPRGQRVDGPVPQGHWKTITLTAAIRLGGVIEPACMAFDGATDAATFEHYVERALVPTLRPGDIVIMDNLSSHKGPRVEQLIRSVGAEVRYLPAYSPDFNPIEKMFSKLKAFLRKVGARGIARLYDALGDALRGVTVKDILGWFRSCGYSTHKREPL